MTIPRTEDLGPAFFKIGQDYSSVKAEIAAIAPSVRKSAFAADRAPLPTDDASQGFQVGSRWAWGGQEWVATAVGAGIARWLPLLDVTPELFGAKGDGVTDDTAAILAAQAWASTYGVPLWFAAKTYAYTGQMTVTGARAEWIGARGRTTLICKGQSSGGSRIVFNTEKVDLRGITFDANKAEVSYNAWGVLFPLAVRELYVEGCGFKNAIGSLGNGAFVQGNGSGVLDGFHDASFVFENNDFTDNTQSGLWVSNAAGVRIVGNRFGRNATYGVRIDTQDPAFINTNQRTIVSQNLCWANQHGIGIGNFNRDNTLAPNVLWESGFADTRTTIISDNHSWANTGYGLVLDNSFNIASNNIITGNGSAAVLMNATDSDLIGGYYQGTTPWIIDTGGSKLITVRGCKVRGGVIGINFGGTYESTLADCDVAGASSYQIKLCATETDHLGVAFQQKGGRCTVRNNTVRMHDNTTVGILLDEGVPDCIVEDNDFWIGGSATFDTAVFNCLDLMAPNPSIRGNRVNGKSFTTRNPSAGEVLIPDILDEIHMTGASGTLTGIRPRSHSYYNQRVSYVSVSHRGNPGATPFTGTLPTTITFTGGGGSGATAQPFFDQQGYLVGARMTNRGSGYTSAPTPVIGGDGAGHIITPQVGVPLADGRIIKLWSNTACALARSGTPVVAGGSGANASMTAGSALTLVARFGRWNVEQSAQGPSMTGAGTPEGTIVAPVGTLYHRTDGGTATTLYVKESGTGATGWVAK